MWGSQDTSLLLVLQLCWTHWQICIKGLISRLIHAIRSQNHFGYAYIVEWLLFLSSSPCIQFLPKEREDAQVADASSACLLCASKPVFTRKKDLRVCTGAHTCATVQTQWLWIWCRVTSRIKEKIFCKHTGTAQHLLLPTSASGNIESYVYLGHSCPREDRANNRQEVAWKSEGTFARSCWQSWEFSVLYRAGP